MKYESGEKILVELEEVVLEPKPQAMPGQLLSVIVPVYNQSKYLPECLDSLLEQTYKKLEIIIVDDGSTDNSAEVAERYARRDSRFKLVRHQANQGLSQARNTGLSRAIGQYVHFLDGDDYLYTAEAYEKMLGAALRENADILSGNIYSESYDCFVGADLEGWVKSKEGKARLIKTSAPMCWRYLYKKAFLDKYNLRFDPEVPIGAEDFLFMVQAAYHSEGIYVVPLLFYFWRQNEDSITGTKDPERVALFEKYRDIGTEKARKFALEHDIKVFEDIGARVRQK
ncbi:glycosyl transferase GTA-type super family [Candidatus Termititenax aidoneus]|uniref:Glycosyl transferase GTA-type super family n=1 Tax=Termititenax aidoneus TaxID=2218524 RepID=A0A388TDG1_TERA1|nr:glycosyl transferase GTA-type super family [Candidatus Termititenax aidoneus]